MSSALKPVLPPTGAQTSAANPPSTTSKPITGSQGMAQHAGAPGPYTTGPLGHVPQNLAGLPHSHGNIGLPSTNMAANMSMNTVSNMSQMGGHGSINQTPPLNMQGHNSSMKTSALPPSVTSSSPAATTAGAVLGRPVPHSYLPSGNIPAGPPQEEGTTLPPSQNSAQLMAMHRAQQQQQQQQQVQNQQHNQNQHHPEQSQQSTPDRFKSQSNQQPQINPHQQPQQVQQPPAQLPPNPHQQQQNQHIPVQSNGTVSGSTDSTNNKITVPTLPNADIKTENVPSVASSIQNHVTSSGDHEVNNAKQPENSATSTPSFDIVSVPPQNPEITNSDQKPVVATTPTPEPVTEAPQQAATTPTKTAAVPKEISKPPSTMKLATTRTTSRKRETKVAKVSESPKSTTSSPTKTPDGKSPGAQNNRPPDKSKTPRTPSEERKSKRTRTRTQPYQSPIPELALISKLSSSASPSKQQDEKLIVFYKNEFLAVRNAEGGFYVCQAVQNVYKSSLRIRIRWLSQDKQDKIYIPDFYDVTDFDCILTNLNMERVEKGKYNLPKDELERTENILKRALAVESGEATPSLTEEHPDGLDLSLFRDESQLKKKRKSLKRKSTQSFSAASGTNSKRTKKTPDKLKVKKVSKSPAFKAAVKRNNQSMDRKSTSNSNATNAIDMKLDNSKSVRKSDGGRAERAKRRGEASTPITSKTSPVVDQKKARVLAKVAMKTAVSAITPTHNKKKAGRNFPAGNGKVPAAATPVKLGTKSTRSSVSAAVAAMVSASTASTFSTASTSSTRRGKKTKK